MGVEVEEEIRNIKFGRQLEVSKQEMGVEVEEEIRNIKFGRQLEVSAQEITLKRRINKKWVAIFIKV